MQKIDPSLWKELESESIRKIKSKSQINNSGVAPEGSWIEKVVAKVKISDLANEAGVEECPVCHYGIVFDDGRGWFICVHTKYNGSCKDSSERFCGNIVDFTRRFF